MSLTKCLLMTAPVPFLNLVFMISQSTADSFPKTQKNLNESAALGCDRPCSGVTQWKRDGKEMAQCGPGAKTGFELTCTVNTGQTTLTVTQVSYSTRGLYSVYCAGREIIQCRQFLQLLTPEFILELGAGEDLKVDLQISGTVRILFKTGNFSSVQLCSVDGRHSECIPEYQKRVFIVGNSFNLRNMTPSDSGIYTIQEEDGTSVSVWNMTINGGRSLNTVISTPGENQDLIRSLHDVQQIQTCKEVFGKEAVIFGVAMLVIGVILGVFGVPRMLRLKDRVLRRPRGSSSSSRDPSGSVENGGVPLKEDLQGNMDPEG